MKAILQLTATFYLIIFMIGGGRVCGCEMLELFGFSHEHQEESCSHHHEDDCSHDSETDHFPSDDEHSPDCCDFLKPIEADLPKTVEIPQIENLGMIGEFVDEIVFSILPGDFASKGWPYPPPDDWVDSRFSLSALQRFLV